MIPTLKSEGQQPVRKVKPWAGEFRGRKRELEVGCDCCEEKNIWGVPWIKESVA